MQTQACFPVWAPLIDEVNRTYGQGVVLGEFITSNINYTYAEGNLHGDNRMTEYEKEATGADITLNTTWLPREAGAKMFGEVHPSGNESETVADSGTAYGGLGYIKKCKRDGIVYYEVKWVFKTAFSKPNDATTTKQGNIQFNTPSITGKAFPLPDFAIDHSWEYPTLAEAMAKLKSLANISEDGFIAQPCFFPDNGAAITADTLITIACGTPGAAVYYTVDGTEPTDASTPFTAPFSVAATSAVKAVAIKGNSVSDISTRIYKI